MRCMKFRSVQSVSELTLKSKTLLSWAGGWVPLSIHVWQTRRLNSQEKLIASIQTTHRRFLKGFLNKLLRTLWREIRRQQLYDRMNNLRLIFSTTPVLSKIRSDRDPGNPYFECVLYISLYSVWAMAMVILMAPLVFKMFQIQHIIWGKDWEQGKKRCMSHEEQLQKGTGGEGEHLWRPNVSHISWALTFHPL